MADTTKPLFQGILEACGSLIRYKISTNIYMDCINNDKLLLNAVEETAYISLKLLNNLCIVIRKHLRMNSPLIVEIDTDNLVLERSKYYGKIWRDIILSIKRKIIFPDFNLATKIPNLSNIMKNQNHKLNLIFDHDNLFAHIERVKEGKNDNLCISLDHLSHTTSSEKRSREENFYKIIEHRALLKQFRRC